MWKATVLMTQVVYNIGDTYQELSKESKEWSTVRAGVKQPVG